MSKSYEALLGLSEDELRQAFMWGAIEEKNRYRPAREDEVPSKYLEELLKDKAKRLEPLRLLHRDSSHGYTDFPGRALPREPEAVDEETQRRITKEAHSKFSSLKSDEETRALTRSVTARLRQYAITELRTGRDPSGVLRAVEDLLQGEQQRRAA